MSTRKTLVLITASSDAPVALEHAAQVDENLTALRLESASTSAPSTIR